MVSRCLSIPDLGQAPQPWLLLLTDAKRSCVETLVNDELSNIRRSPAAAAAECQMTTDGVRGGTATPSGRLVELLS